MRQYRSYRSRLLASVLLLTLIEPVSAEIPQIKKNDLRTRKTPLAAPIITIEPPPGFESLTKPRDLLVDVVYAGEKLGQVAVVASPGAIEIKEPDKAVRLIANVKQADKVVTALTGPLPANTALVCRKTQDGAQPACGALNPQVAGVIFDENNLALHVFVAEPYLDPRAIRPKKFLPRPDGGWGFLSRFDTAFSGETGKSELASLRNVSYLSYRETRLHTDFSLSTRNGLFADTLALQIDRPEWFYAAGFLRGLGSAVVPETRFYGGRIWSSTELRVDREQAFGSQILIFLQRPSYVEILRDGRLVSTRFYPAGNRVIDTSGLPSGSYNIAVQVREVGGETREESQFFAKTEILPPADQPLFYFDGGVLPEDRTSGLPPPSNVPIGKIAARVRVWHGLALGGEIAGTNKEGVFEGDTFLFTDWGRATASASVTSALDYGLSGSVSAQYGPVGFYVNGRYVRASRTRIDRPAEPQNFRFINGNSLQLNGAITYQLNRARLGFSGQLVRNYSSGQRETYAVGPNFQYNIVRSFEHTVDFESEFLKTDRGYSAYARLVWRWNPPTNYYVNAYAGVRALRDTPGQNEVLQSIQVQGSYRLGPYFDHDFAIEPSLQSEGPTFAGVDLTGDGPLGRLRAGVHHSFGNGNAPSTGYGVNLSTGFAIDRNGFAFGGRDSNASAVIVRVNGPPSAGKYRVHINGSPRILIAAGETRPLYLVPYQAYEISLRPADTNSGLANIGGVNRKVVLYPGTTTTIEWNVEPVVVVFGRVLDDNGIPVANAKIEGGVGAAESDGRGYFQVEVNKTTTLQFRDERDRVCEVRFHDLKSEANFARIGDVSCRPKG